MFGISKVWKSVFALLLFACGAFGYSSITFQGNTLGVDDAGRLDCVFDPCGGLTTFGYTDAGNLEWKRNAEDELTEYGYDELNRLVAVTNQGVEVATFDHDNNGNIVEATSPSLSTTTFGYDEMNLLVASTSTVGAVSSPLKVGYGFDLNGNRTNIVYPGGLVVSYAYGADNRLESVTTKYSNNTKTVSFGYDTANRLTGISYPNGVNSTFGLDAEGRVVSIQHGNFVDRTIQRNELGFKETELIDAGLKPTAPETARRVKTHNDADQLTSEWVQQGTNEYTITYDYSDNGCLTNVSQASLPAVSYSYDYDNRIVSASSASSAVQYLYDASGARIGRIAGGSPAVTNYFVVDYTDGLKRPLAETDFSGTVTRYYVWSGSQLLCHIDANGDVFYYHSDELGSTLALTDASGNVTDEFAYMPYGYASHSGSTSTPFQWLGGYGVYYDADTDLHLTLHRAYSSKLKRFISADPLGINGGINVYAMANLNPLFFVDPYGLSGLESTSSYLGRSWEQIWKGNYTDNVTALGTAGQVVSGIFDLDLPGDIRDLTYDVQNWEWSWKHAGQTALDGIGLLPVIGALKYADEGSTLLKQANNIGLDDFVHITPTKYTDSILENGLNPDISGYVTKWKYVQDVSDPSTFNTMLYRQDLWPSTAGKFDDGAAILKIDQSGANYLGPRTNWKNGIPQWKYNEIVDPANIQRVR